MSADIEQLVIQNYGPIKDATLSLSPLHALIGPNDAGKSMTLKAIRSALSLLVHAGDPASVARLGTSFRLQFTDSGWLSWTWQAGPDGFGNGGPVHNLHPIVGGLATLRLDPDELRAATPLLDDAAPLWFSNDRGLGLGSLLDAIQTRSQKTRDELVGHLRTVFPLVDEFRFWTHNQQRVVGVRLRDGTEVRANDLSEGMLYFLAFAAIRFMRPMQLILIEEPENGLHPARIREVVRVLRELSKTVQVLLTTHSPLVINELEAHEVTLVTRTEAEGTKFTRMDRTPHFEERSSGWNLGELWIALADGVLEADLLNPKG